VSDSDILTNLATAIMTKFNALSGSAHNAFWTAVNGQLFEGEAKTGTPPPYSVFSFVSHTPERTFTEDHRDFLIQFSHFSESQAEVKIINVSCNDLFDECAPFTITGAKLEWMRFSNSPGAFPDEEVGENGGWHCPTDYSVRVSMN